MKVLLTGGGTGGHIYPAIAIAIALAREAAGAKVLFAGNASGLEASIVPRAGLPIQFVASRSLRRGRPLELLATIALNAAGFAQALRLVAGFRPDIVVATGGYVSLPVVAAARVLRGLRLVSARLALLEPNAVPGLTNRLLAPLVDEVWGTFVEAAGAFPGKFRRTGTPVRGNLWVERPAAEARAALGLDPAKRTILVIGGSQGARSVNAAAADLVGSPGFPTEWQVVHLSGERDFAFVREKERPAIDAGRVVLLPYLDEMADAYRAADLAVSRAGASALAELAATRTPSLLIPYPHATGDHQRRNAESLVRAGGAELIDDGRLDAATLRAAIDSALDPQRLKAMKRALESIVPSDPSAEIVMRIKSLTALPGMAS